MHTWFNNPVLQSSLFPFLVAMVCGLLANRWHAKIAPVCILLGYACAFFMILGFSSLTLTTTTRLALLAVCSFCILWLVEIVAGSKKITFVLVFVLTVFGFTAVFYTILKNMPWTEGMIWSGIAWSYVGVVLVAMIKQQNSQIKQYTGLWVLALVTGMLAFVYGSASVAQFNFALCAAIGAWLLLLLFSKRPMDYFNLSVLVPVVLLIGFMAMDMVVREEDAFVLLPMVFIVLLNLVPTQSDKRWQQLVWALVLAIPGTVLSLIWLWYTADWSTVY